MADDDLKRLQIRKTIEEHLEKELVLTAQGIKVLSLFFIDKVANYRSYDEDGNPVKGKYAQWFEEEYAELIQREKYKTLFADVDTESLPEIVHNGYFAQDKGKFKDSTTGSSEADSDAYSLIMKDKERLLSFSSKLKFIFSHSALREGWDNPNVFQICTLNETASVLKKRQEIGRGLRLAVNQDGERIQGFEVNTLTVMANEAYESFVRRLQKEMEEDEDLHFGTVLEHQFANITQTNLDGTTSYIGEKESKKLYEHLKKEGHIDKKGKVQDSLRIALKDKTLELPAELKPVEEATSGDSADVTATGKKVYIGKNAGSDNNTLTVNGTLVTNEVRVGAEGNTGNLLVVNGSLTAANGIWVAVGSSLENLGIISGVISLAEGASIFGDLSLGAGDSIGGGGTIDGDLSLSTGAKFKFNLSQTLTVTGTVSIDSTFGIKDIVGLSGSMALGTDKLIDGTATDFSLLGLRNWGVEKAYHIGGGKAAYFQEGSLELVIIAVPEPSAWALTVFTLAALTILRRRKLALDR